MKRVILVLLVSAVVAAGAVAQQASQDPFGGDGTNTEHRVFGLRLGLVGGFDIGDEEALSGRVFAFTVPVNQSLQIGITAVDLTINTTGAADFVMFSAEYFLSRRLGLELMSGTGPTEVGGGVNIFYSLLSSLEEDFLSSALRVQAGYIFDSSDGVENGSVTFGLSASLGL